MTAPPGNARTSTNGITGTRTKAEIRRELTPTITGAAVLTLEQARPRITQAHPIDSLPPGARLIVDVGRAAVDHDTAVYLNAHAHRINVEVHGHPDVIGSWIRAVRAPDAYYADLAERDRGAWGYA